MQSYSYRDRHFGRIIITTIIIIIIIVIDSIVEIVKRREEERNLNTSRFSIKMNRRRVRVQDRPNFFARILKKRRKKEKKEEKFDER